MLVMVCGMGECAFSRGLECEKRGPSICTSRVGVVTPPFRRSGIMSGGTRSLLSFPFITFSCSLGIFGLLGSALSEISEGEKKNRV